MQSSSKVEQNNVEDHLDVDNPIPGQNFVCLSFVSPEKVLKQKEDFLRQKFWEYLKENSDERFDLSILDNISDVYLTFMHEKGQELEDAFHKDNQFQTSVRGLKVRGTYSTMEEASIRSKVLQRLDQTHHVFVAPVGYWLPWDPDADQIEQQEYQEEQLNELMKNYKENDVKRNIYYENEKKEMKDKAMEENMRRKNENENEKEKEKEKENDKNDDSASSVFDKMNDSSHEDLKKGYSH